MCDGGEVCCGTGCIPASYICCADGGACASGEFCCNDSFGGCCPNGDTCTSDNTCRPHSSGLPTGAIVGIVFGVIALISIGLRCFFANRKRDPSRTPLSQRVVFAPPRQATTDAPQELSTTQPTAYATKSGATVSRPQEYSMPNTMPPAYLSSNEGRQDHA